MGRWNSISLASTMPRTIGGMDSLMLRLSVLKKGSVRVPEASAMRTFSRRK